MKRGDFLRKTLASAVIANQSGLINILGSTMRIDKKDVLELDLNSIPKNTVAQFELLCKWLNKNGWTNFIKQSIQLEGIEYGNYMELCKTIEKIADYKSTVEGLSDFGGIRLIEPGNPSLSLLYHILASPRVKSKMFLEYPSLEQIDALENFIYSLKKWEDYEKDFNLNTSAIMVLAYEFRPAFKTPVLNPDWDFSNNKYAQIVFSRTGVGRIGEHPMNYDAENRCFINKPSTQGKTKQIAVTPARYALFLVNLVKVERKNSDEIKLMNYEKYDSRIDADRYFIRPVRKLFNEDDMSITFAEYHLNEKLRTLAKFQFGDESLEFSTKIKLDAIPFVRQSSKKDNGTRINQDECFDDKMVFIKRVGESVLIGSHPNSLIRLAEQDGKLLSFKVPKKWEKRKLSNRRYNAFKATDFKTRDVIDAIWTDFVFRRNRRTTRFNVPKNAPLFVNIKSKVGNVPNSVIPIDFNELEKIICEGGYFAPLYEDSICDGCVSAKIDTTNNNNDTINKSSPLKRWLENEKVLPAFSLITAPDFFPYADSNDIRTYYFTNGHKTDLHFLEGGTINLSGIRIPPNQRIKDPFTNGIAFSEDQLDKCFETFTSVVSINDKHAYGSDRFKKSYLRDYKSTSYLPDTCSGIFFPGWDVTYSTSDESNRPFLATFGLGSPFPEDMKLCAAANGMWPVVSPDAGRTFQGSLEPFPLYGKPSTSVPLMDDELGLHANSPHVTMFNQKVSYGWDGEQGPFLKWDQSKNKWVINFTDVGRADYLSNLLDPNIGFDMSNLRDLTSEELIRRMEALRVSIKKIAPRQKYSEPQRTPYWLVSAESVNDWENGAKGYGIPNHLFGLDNSWAKFNSGLKGPGFLFLFAITKDNGIETEIVNPSDPKCKRRDQVVLKLAICQVALKSSSDIAICRYNIFNNLDAQLTGTKINEWKI